MNGELVKTLDNSENTVTSQVQRERETDGERGRQREGETVGEREGKQEVELPRGDCTYSLGQLAYLRSGDKGNTANIGQTSFTSYVLVYVMYIHNILIPSSSLKKLSREKTFAFFMVS